jgi:hypothetical protein
VPKVCSRWLKYGIGLPEVVEVSARKHRCTLGCNEVTEVCPEVFPRCLRFDRGGWYVPLVVTKGLM